MEEEGQTAMKMYFVREEMRMKQIMKKIDMRDIMRNDGNDLKLHEQFKGKPFYNLHLLLRYQQDTLTSSYVRPTIRNGSSGPVGCNRRRPGLQRKSEITGKIF